MLNNEGFSTRVKTRMPSMQNKTEIPISQGRETVFCRSPLVWNLKQIQPLRRRCHFGTYPRNSPIWLFIHCANSNFKRLQYSRNHIHTNIVAKDKICLGIYLLDHFCFSSVPCITMTTFSKDLNSEVNPSLG